MFEHTSRYYNLETAHHTMPDGRLAAYKRRRFLPHTQNQPVLIELKVAEGDRLDLLTAKVLGDPEQFWHLCDMNNAMNPAELTQPPGRTLHVMLPQPQTTQPSVPPGALPGG